MHFFVKLIHVSCHATTSLIYFCYHVNLSKKMKFYWSHNLFSRHSNCITLLFFRLAFLWKNFCKFSKNIIIWNLFQCVSLGKWRHHSSSRSSPSGTGQMDVVNQTSGGVHNKLVSLCLFYDMYVKHDF